MRHNAANLLRNTLNADCHGTGVPRTSQAAKKIIALQLAISHLKLIGWPSVNSQYFLYVASVSLPADQTSVATQPEMPPYRQH